MEETRLIEFRCIDRNRTDKHGRRLEFVRRKRTPEEAAKSVAEYLAGCEMNIHSFWIEVHDPDRKTPYLFKATRDPRPRIQVVDHTNGPLEK